MAEDKQHAKKAILTELESIKGLLDEEADNSVPTLQEVVLSEDELEQTALEIAPDEASQAKPADHSASTLRPSGSLEQDHDGDASADTAIAETGIGGLDDENSPDFSNDPLAPLPGQQSLFGDPDVAKPQHHKLSRRNKKRLKKQNEALPQAQGDNPFLPKHIRERLQGNKPHYGMKDFVATEDNIKTLKATQQQALIDDLVAEFMPQIETELRSRLADLLSNQEEASQADSPEKSE